MSTPQDPTARAHLRGYLLAVLPDPGAPPIFPIEVTVRTSNGLKIETTYSRHDVLVEGRQAGQSAVPLTRVQRKILEQAGPVPRSAKQLIAAAGYKPNSYAREAVTYLARHGLLRRIKGGGYLRAA